MHNRQFTDSPLDHDYQDQDLTLEYIRRRRQEWYHEALAITESLEQFVASVQN